MGLLKKEEGVERIHLHLKNSFANVRKDTAALFEWIEYLHQKTQQQEEIIHQQNSTLTDLHGHVSSNFLTHHDVKQLIDSHFTLQDMQGRMNHIHKKVEMMTSLHDQHNDQFKELRSRLENTQIITEKKSTALKEKLIKNLTRNSKVYVKNAIVGYVEKYGEISGLQLKGLVVEEQQLCSKSSFYRLLQELEDGESVSVLREGKQKTYMSKPKKIGISRR